MQTFEAFLFKHYAFDASTGRLSLAYAFQGGPAFEEVLQFPLPLAPLDVEAQRALDRAFRLIFLLAGVSYYKAYVPPVLRCEAFELDAETAAFLHKVYLNGLGEFAYRNKIDLRDALFFENTRLEPQMILPHVMQPETPRYLVPIGGGKDSLVTIEALKRAGRDVTLFVLTSPDGVAAPIAATAAQSGLPVLTVTRALSKNLFDLNKAGALNGHVPITAILSAVAVACALMHGQRAIVLSNEHSASAPNLQMAGLDINHQYSKSLAFETDFAHFVQSHVAADLNYFSFLRPLTEAEIARRFAKLETYHSSFRSCNTAFRQSGAERGTYWCCDCPKCRFVFLALAPHMDKAKLTAIFGRNMLDDPSQEEGFRELCGLYAHKPFECVGETEECALLMERLQQMEEWQGDAIVQTLAPLIPFEGEDFEKRYQTLFSARYPHRLPPEMIEVLNADL